MKHFDLRLNNRSGEYWLYVGIPKDANGDPLEETVQLGSILLSFSMSFTSPVAANDFHVYTDLPLQPDTNKIFTFLHEWSMAEAGAPSISTVQVDPATQQVALSAPQFVPELPEHRPLLLSVTDAAGKQIITETLRRQVEGVPPYVLSLVEEDWGVYHLDLTNTSGEAVAETAQFCTAIPGGNQGLWGLVQLHIPKVEINAREPLVIDQIPGLKLAFESRGTRWRYNLINHNNVNFDGLQLSNNKEPIAYTESNRETNQEGQVSKVTLTLDEDIKLLKNQTTVIQLDLLKKNGGEEMESSLSISLPHPVPNQIKVERIDGVLTAFSDMYIHI